VVKILTRLITKAAIATGDLPVDDGQEQGDD
jgi:hypothetical protein